MVYGCFLSYYGDYFESSLNEFLLILNSTVGDYCCLVIDNGNLSDVHIGLAKSNGCIVISGDNRLAEFSGWQKALDYIKSNYKFELGHLDSFVFANDTFNQHRNWNLKKRLGVIAGILECQKLRTVPTLIGHVDRNKELFSISGLPCQYWVSTFLFITNFEFINRIEWELALTDEKLKEYYSKVDDSGIHWKSNISKSLQSHLSQWLFPEHDRLNSWYGASTKTPSQKEFKLTAILNEKYLSARCVSENGRLVSWLTKVEYLLLIIKNYKSIFRIMK